MVIDSGATTHFCSEEMDLPKEGESNKAVYLPNGDIIRTTKRTSLPFQQLSKKAREAHVLPQLRQSLMSVNKLSEEGYTTIFHPENEGVTVHEKGTLTIATSSPPVLQGCKEKGDNLWTVSTNEEESEEEANNVYNLPSTKQSIRYLHAAAGFPVKSEWIKAIKAGNYITWPELTAEAVHKHFPESDETQKGHMKQQHQNVRSTKVKQNATNNGGGDDDDRDDQIKPQTKLKDVYIKIYLANDTVHFDQTGHFPATSSSGNKYIMVLVEIDSNVILVEPMKSRKDKGNDPGIRRFSRTLTAIRHSTQKACPRQRNIHHHESPHRQQIQISTRTRPTRVPSPKCSRSRHPQLQSSFSQCIGGYLTNFSA